jgi:hypothetical protein
MNPQNSLIAPTAAADFFEWPSAAETLIRHGRDERNGETRVWVTHSDFEDATSPRAHWSGWITPFKQSNNQHQPRR